MVARGTLGYALVVLGGLVVSPLPGSSAVANLPGLDVLRASMPGRMLGLLVVVVGLGLATSAWLRLVRHAGDQSRADPRARLATARRATWCWAAPLLPAPPLFSRDAWSYAAQGELTRLGLSPYRWTAAILDGPIVEAVDPRWLDTLTPYGPLPLLWGGVAARVTADPWLLVVGHRLLAVAGLLLLSYALPRLARRSARDPAHATALALPSPVMLAHGIGGAHNDVVMVGLMALALVLATERAWVAGAVVGGLAAAVKLPAGLVCVGVALASLGVRSARRQRTRRFAAVALLSVGALALTGAVAGVGVGWVHALAVPGEVRTPLSVTTVLGVLLEWALEPWGTVLAQADPVALVRGAGVAVILLLAGRTAFGAPTGVAGAAVRAAAALMTVTVVMSPVVHPWYLLWCLPLLAACHLGPRAGSLVLHLSWVAGLTAPLDSSLAGGGAVLPVAVGLVVTAVAIQARGHRAASTTDPRPDLAART